MLILTRSHNQRIFIGEDIKITMLSINHQYKNVRLGIEAPKNINVYREEIYLRMKREQEEIWNLIS